MKERNEIPDSIMELHHELLDCIQNIIKPDTKRILAKKLGVSESMSGLLMKGYRTWTPKYLDKLSTKYSLGKDEARNLHKLAACIAGYRLD